MIVRVRHIAHHYCQINHIIIRRIIIIIIIIIMIIIIMVLITCFDFDFRNEILYFNLVILYLFLLFLGWHRRLNTRVTGPPPLYNLVDILHKEASFISVQMKLVSERKLKKQQTRNSKTSQTKIFSLWGDYTNGHISSTKLLKKLASVYTPVTEVN